MNTDIKEPVVKILGDVIYLQVHGVNTSWPTYKFTVDVDAPGRKVRSLYVLRLLNNFCRL